VETGLIVTEQADLANLKDPAASADFVCYLGVMGLPEDQIPGREYEYDQDQEIITWVEPERDYINRVWNRLSPKRKGQAIQIGLQKAGAYREGLRDGIQLVVFRAYSHGWWLETMEGDGGDGSFRAWVKDAITAEGQSATEATQLASTILNLTWLKANLFDGLPDDLETAFMDRSRYSRWRRMASAFRRLIEAAEDAGQEPEEEGPTVDDKIQELVDEVNNPDNDLDDLDQAARQKPALPPVVLTEERRDDAGRCLIRGAISPAQRTYLQQKLGKMLSYELEGQQYGADTHVLVEYREQRERWCKKCGSASRGHECCPACGEFDNWLVAENWHRRVEGGDWERLEETPELTGFFDSALYDREMGLAYLRYYEEQPAWVLGEPGIFPAEIGGER
jgi:hypothetical protein